MSLSPNNLSSAHLIFDLDGTLIDSHPGIIASLRFALAENNHPFDIPISEVPVGPPLRDLIETILHSNDQSVIDPVILSFKKHYDSVGFAHSCLFDGVYDFLFSLKQLNCTLFVATNKRNIPARKILDHLHISKFFDDVYAVDSIEGGFGSKALMLKRLVSDYSLSTNAIYLGDRYDDYSSALFNSLLFCFPSWGYSVDRHLFPSDVLSIDISQSRYLKSLAISH